MCWVWFGLGGVLGAATAALLFWRFRRRGSGPASPVAKEQLTELAQITGGLAHEIKNPLSTINVNLRLLAEDMQRHEDDEHRRWLRRLGSVQEEADRLRATLDDFQRLAGQVELSPETVDLRAVVNELVDFFTPQAEADGVVLRPNLPAEPITCSIDVKLIKQALLNLMLNAAQAMTDGGELIVGVSADGDDAAIEVIDTGPGLAPDQLERIFSAYYSTKTGGTGLGLPTTRRIVREHGGRIRVESEPGKGTRFVVLLPQRRD